MELKRELLTILRKQLLEAHAEMQRHLDDNDLRTLALVAHKYKSTALSVGLTDITNLMKKTEIACKQILLRQETADSEQIDLLRKQTDVLPEDLNEWTEKNLSTESIQNLINICKLQCLKAVCETDQELQRIDHTTKNRN